MREIKMIETDMLICYGFLYLLWPNVMLTLLKKSKF